MILDDEFQITLDRDRAFKGLNDPEILKNSIPGYESMASISSSDLQAVVVVNFGPVTAKSEP